VIYTATAKRVARAGVVAAVLAIVLSTPVFVSVDLVRVALITAPARPAAGLVRGSAAGRPGADALHPPFAVTARITSGVPDTRSFSIVVDRVPICTRDLAAGRARRVDCQVVAGWNPAIDHEVVVAGPPADWTVDSLELSTHHGRNAGLNAFVVLPAGSDQYVRPGAAWVIVVWLLLTALMTFVPPAAMPRWLRIGHRILAGAIVLQLVISQALDWFSSYRVVFSAATFARFMVVLFAARLWTIGRAVVNVALGAAPAGSAARRRRAWALALVLLSVGAAVGLSAGWQRYRAYSARSRLLAELQPIALENCQFKRFGEANDGGYVLCANLLGRAMSAYSYGISGYDQWGCDVSRGLSIPVHQYDCFDVHEPSCPGGHAVFHPECVGASTVVIDGRPFDFPEHQFEKNGDAGKRLVVKMDVEGAEWDTLAQASDAALDRIDQLAIELHGVDEPERNLAVIRRLKQFFYVASLHFNNSGCRQGIAPFPSWAYEALFVNKRIGVAGGSAPPGAPASEIARNNLEWTDCQSLTDLPQRRP